MKLLETLLNSKKLKGGAIGGTGATAIAGMLAAGLISEHAAIVLGICAVICPALQVIFQGLGDLKKAGRR